MSRWPRPQPLNGAYCPDHPDWWHPNGKECPHGDHSSEKRMNQLPPNPKQAYGDLKIPLGLVPSTALILMGQAFKEGARKYGPYNWREKSVESMTYLHATLRHVAAYIDGEEIDPESGNPHLAHALACLAIIADAAAVGCLLDNRPPHGVAGELLRAKATAPTPTPATMSTDHGESATVASGSGPWFDLDALARLRQSGRY